jgi:S1-C subfamily serine protease
MTDSEFEQPNIEGGDGPPPRVRVSTCIAPPPPPYSRRSHRLRNGALFAATVVALAAGLGLGRVDWKNGPSSISASPASMSATSNFGSSSASASSSSTATTSASTDVSSIADKVDPGLVDIDTLLGFEGEEAAGTGIVLNSSGEVLTNNHVINGATAISVKDIANGKVYSATVVGYDATNDVAILQLNHASGLETASIGNSSNVSVGENVVGIGNAGGTGGMPSAAGGTVTGLNRSIAATDEGDGSSEQLTDLIETNADIQPGDSGGSLVNGLGQVIGIDTAGSTGSSFQSVGESAGIRGYAIPINEATSIAKEIASGSSSSTVHIGSTGYLGVEIESSAQADGGSISGVAGVITGSPAQVAGLAAGDVINSVNGQSVGSANALTGLLDPFRPGEKVTIGWTNPLSQTETASVRLSSGPPR